MLKRDLPIPTQSFLLLGPRGTGKSTWLKNVFPNAKTFNLLRSSEILRLVQDPRLFRREILAMPKGSWVVVDEVQRLPDLLNEVQDLMTEFGIKTYRFALTGSSARKLKRSGVNLMAGRAIQRSIYPLTTHELHKDFTLNKALAFGTLPISWLADSDQERIDYLEAYVETYFKEEIKEEALVRKLEPFIRFLKIAALCHGQVVNVSNISRDASIGRAAAEGYFEILTDTLLGSWIPSWQGRARVKEVSHPKFYLFDPGVQRALAGIVRETLSESERGFLFEGLVLNELRAWAMYSNQKINIYYWRTSDGSEIDFIIEHGRRRIGIEVKASTRWRSDYSKSLNSLIESKKLHSGLAIYLGEDPQKDGAITVLSFNAFIRNLWNKGL